MAPKDTRTTYQKNQDALLASAKKKLAAEQDQTKAMASLSKQEREALRLEYGYAYSLISSDASLMATFTKAVTQGMTPQAFALEIQNTAWAKKRTASQAQYDVLAADPTQKANLQALRTRVIDEIKRMAVAANGVQVDDASALKLANNVLRDNYTNWQDVLPRIVGSTYVTDDVLSFGGAAATSATDIRTFARQMGITLSDATIGRYVDDIASGKNSMENIQSVVRNMAISMYPQFAENIKAGGNMEDVLGNYRNVAANLLEVDPSQLNMFGQNNDSTDPIMMKALFGKDNKAMSMTDFRKEVKKDARWKNTTNARDEYANATRNILRAFGAKF